MPKTRGAANPKTVLLFGCLWIGLLISQAGCAGRSYPVEFLELASVDPTLQDATRQCLKPVSMEQAETGLDRLEILVDAAGKITATRDGSGKTTFKAQLIDTKTPRKLQRERKRRGSLQHPDYCDLIWKAPIKVNESGRDVDEIFRQLTSLQAPFEVQEALGLHISRVTVTAFLPNRSFQADWFGCEDSPIAGWAQALLEQTDRRLNPCNHRGGIVLLF